MAGMKALPFFFVLLAGYYSVCRGTSFTLLRFNCEDLEQFNGAGLYDSVPLSGDELADRTKVQRAIKQVWASVWNHRAVRERDFYKIPHKDVNMAILVQPYLDNKMNGSLAKVQVNGVCITHDVGHHKVKHGFYVNW